MAVLAVWTLATVGKVSSPQRCTRPFLIIDLGVAITGILITPAVEAHQRILDGGPTLPSIWTAGSVLAFAIKGGWRWAAAASCLVGGANLVERGAPARDTLHNVLLVAIASIAIGYVVEVARASERTLARALQIEAATRERERLARDIHDNVLQVLAMVQRRGAEIGGEAEALGRMAGEQEAALRALVTDGAAALPSPAVPPAPMPGPGPAPARTRTRPATCARCSPRTAAPGSPSPPPAPPSSSRPAPHANSPPPWAPPWRTSAGTRARTPTPGSWSRTNPRPYWSASATTAPASPKAASPPPRPRADSGSPSPSAAGSGTSAARRNWCRCPGRGQKSS